MENRTAITKPPRAPRDSWRAFLGEEETQAAPWGQTTSGFSVPEGRGPLAVPLSPHNSRYLPTAPFVFRSTGRHFGVSLVAGLTSRTYIKCVSCIDARRYFQRYYEIQKPFAAWPISKTEGKKKRYSPGTTENVIRKKRCYKLLWILLHRHVLEFRLERKSFLQIKSSRDRVRSDFFFHEKLIDNKNNKIIIKLKALYTIKIKENRPNADCLA